MWGKAYGVSESACGKICHWVEDTLIQGGKFRLPGKKALLKSNVPYEGILIDASDSASI